MYQPKPKPEDDKSIQYTKPDGSSDDSEASIPPTKEYIKKATDYKSDDYNEYDISDKDDTDDRDW